ncbi:MAG: hypothetical protein DRR06_15710 [Gammaproteobacteria bacterium]|nr:MAG: hypothetical protein DRR06_15710 [Gammaproteobacteria bacterium]
MEGTITNKTPEGYWVTHGKTPLGYASAEGLTILDSEVAWALLYVADEAELKKKKEQKEE